MRTKLVFAAIGIGLLVASAVASAGATPNPPAEHETEDTGPSISFCEADASVDACPPGCQNCICIKGVGCICIKY